MDDAKSTDESPKSVEIDTSSISGKPITMLNSSRTGNNQLGQHVDSSVVMDLPKLQSSQSFTSDCYDNSVWTVRNSLYVNNMEKIKQNDLNRNKFAFIIYRPIPSIIICISIGIIIISIGITMTLFGRMVDTILINYDESDTKSIKFEVKRTLHGPVYLYYRITNFYASHKKFAVDMIHNNFTNNRCFSVKTLGELLKVRCINNNNTLFPGIEGEKLCNLVQNNNIDIFKTDIIPCGMPSATIMTDEFDICKSNDGKTCYEQTLPVESRYIDIFKSIFEYSDDKMVWIDPMNVRLRRWNATPFGPSFQVLYGIIANDIPAGTYYLNLKSNTWPCKKWKAEKAVVLATTTVFGDKGTLFIIITFVIGGLYFLTGILFLVVHLMTCVPKKDYIDTIRRGDDLNLAPPICSDEATDDGFNDCVEPEGDNPMPCLCPLH